jgi:hypothetical protein
MYQVGGDITPFSLLVPKLNRQSSENGYDHREDDSRVK